MDSMILIVSLVVIILLGLLALLLSMTGKSKKKKVKIAKKIKPKKSKVVQSSKTAIEIDPAALCTKMFTLAPSEMKKAKQDYIGREVEIRTVLNSITGSKIGTTYRYVVLDYQDNRNFHILGDINMRDYKDQSWMTREGKLKVVGIVKEFQPKEILLDNIKII
ncbi:MAG: hypothetical protein HQ508_00375 [Candidatus Marinimicrobia bacterium]|nr:hypothetical protein [Candidatus Neomarinimicrobiota bacterium]